MNEQRRQAAIEAGARALDPTAWATVDEEDDWPTDLHLAARQARARSIDRAAAVIDAAAPHLAAAAWADAADLLSAVTAAAYIPTRVPSTRS